VSIIYMPGSGSIHVLSPQVRVEVFPDGEMAIRIPTGLRGANVTLVGHCATAMDSEAFLAAAYEIASQGPIKLTIINTYFRNARSERSTDGNAILAKFQARQWSGLGRVFPGVVLVFVDLHKDLILNYFEGPVVTEHRVFRPMLEEAVRDYRQLDNPVYATVDAGGVYEAKALADEAMAGFAHIEKKRLSGTETEIRNVSGDDVRGRDVVIFDDIIATGSSMLKAAEAYLDRGAKSVICAATHGVFVGDAVDKFKASRIERVFITNSHPNAFKAAEQAPDLIRVKTLFY
jgi:ribose-phosphate pyrophosphokinase